MSENTNDPAALEARAREMGWRPKEEFTGDESRWIDAETYVERGEQVLPILRSQNQKLHSELTGVQTRLNEVTTAFAQSQETITALQDFQADMVKDRVAAARDKLLTELKEAKRGGDVDTEVELTAELGRLNAAEAAAGTGTDEKATVADKDKGKPATPVDYTKAPEWTSWQAENPWFDPVKDPVRAATAHGVAQKLRAEGNTLVGKAFLDKVAEETLKVFGGPGRGTAGKVEGSRGGAASGATGGNGRSYNDLPADARAVCDKQASRFVGDGKLYKDVNGWRKHYADVYFAGE